MIVDVFNQELKNESPLTENTLKLYMISVNPFSTHRFSERDYRIVIKYNIRHFFLLKPPCSRRIPTPIKGIYIHAEALCILVELGAYSGGEIRQKN